MSLDSTHKDIHITYIPEVLIELEKELENHPEITFGEHTEVVDRIAELASQLNILVQGYYTEVEIIGLAEICLERLKGTKTPLILAQEF
jgi:hypothetical protein